MAKINKRTIVHMLECPFDHTPNEKVLKSLEDVKKRQGLNKADTVEDLFKKLRQ